MTHKRHVSARQVICLTMMIAAQMFHAWPSQYNHDNSRTCHTFVSAVLKAYPSF